MNNFISRLLNDNNSGSIAEVAEILSSSITITSLPDTLPDLPDKKQDNNNSVIWEPEPDKKQKDIMQACIVIDRNNRWHQKAKVNTTGMHLSDSTWGYYGTNYPVFVESQNRELIPFILQDTAGENSNRLYKGANPSGFKATFKHRNNLMGKIQTGLMIALVLSLLFMMFLFLNWK